MRPHRIDMKAVREVLEWLGRGDIQRRHTSDDEVMQRVCAYDTFERALMRSEIGKGVGCDGFNSYLLPMHHAGTACTCSRQACSEA